MESLFKPVSYKKGAAVSVGAAFVWKILSFVNSIIIASLFSISVRADIYFYLIMLAGLGLSLFLSVNTSVLIPEAMHKEEPRARAFLNRVLVFYVLLGAAAACAAAALPGLFGLISRFDVSAANGMFFWASLYFALSLVTQFLINILEMKGMFKVALLSPLNALLPFISLIFFGKGSGIIVMLYAFCAAQFLQGLFCLYALLKTGWRFNFSDGGVSKGMRKNLFSVVILEILNIITGGAPLFIMSGLGGFVSALNYAKQLFETPGEIVVNRITGVMRIEFNHFSAAAKSEELNAAFEKTFLTLILIMAPLCVFTTVFSTDIVSVLFMRGRFGAMAVMKTSMFLTLFMPGVLLLVPSYVQRALIASAKKMREFLPYQAFASALMLSLVYFLMKQGPYGYPAAFFISNFIWLFLAYFMFKKLMPYIKYSATMRVMFKVIVLNILAVIPSVILARFIDGGILRPLACGILFVILTALLSQKFYKIEIRKYK